MTKANMLTKRVAIDKANAQTFAALAAAAFISVFCLLAAKSVWSQNSYQSRVITAKSKADNQLKKNIQAYESLTTSYESFVSTPNNIIGGSSTGTGNSDGDNAKIILDALPPSYDFPALTSTVEKILSHGGYKVSSVTGTDDQLNQQNNTASSNPQPVPMPFSFSISNTNFSFEGQLINLLESSIRPIQIDNLNITGGGNNIALVVNAHTYYQPGKSLTITSQVIK